MLSLHLHAHAHRLFAELSRERNLSFQKIFQRAVPIRHGMQMILPDGRGIRVGHIIGQSVHQQVGRWRGNQIFLFSLRFQKAALDEILDDGGACRFRADAVDILQLLFRLRILHIFMDFLHACQQRGRCEALRRFCDAFREFSAFVVHGILLFHRRQRCLLLVLRLFFLVLLFFPPRRRGVKLFPPNLPHNAATGREQLILVVHAHFRLVIHMDRVKLRDIAPGNQLVKVPLLLRQAVQLGLHRCRDDGMVRGNLLVVPCAAFLLRIRARRPFRKLCASRHAKFLQDGLRIPELVRRQILAIRSRIGREFLFIQGLSRIQHHLGLIAVAPARKHLQGRKGKRKRRRLLFLLLFVGRNFSLPRLLQELLQLLLRDFLVQQPPLAVQPRLLLLRLPLRRKGTVRMPEFRLDAIVVHRLEILDLPLPAHDQCQRRCLDAPDGQDDAVVARTPCRQRVGTRKIHADEPIRPRPGKRGLLQIVELRIVSQGSICLLDALFVQRIQQNAFHRLRIAQIVQHLVHKKLSFAVRVARMHNLVRLRNKPLHDAELLFTVLRHKELPLRGNNGQILRPPALETLVILLRLGLPQNMPEQPGNDSLPRGKIAVMPAHRPLQAFRKLPAHAGLLRNV